MPLHIFSYVILNCKTKQKKYNLLTYAESMGPYGYMDMLFVCAGAFMVHVLNIVVICAVNILLAI